MKPKKLPREIRAYLILQGLFFGQVIGTATLALSMAILGAVSLGFLVWLVVTMGLWGLWLFISFKYKEDLAKWGLIEIDKPKKKGEDKA